MAGLQSLRRNAAPVFGVADAHKVAEIVKGNTARVTRVVTEEGRLYTKSGH
jgi:hypothetical protein